MRAWLAERFASDEEIGIPWPVIWAFVRISTNPRLFPQPLSRQEAFDVLDSWLSEPGIEILQPGRRHLQLLNDAVVRGQARGTLVTNAVIAAITMEHGGRLATADRDFARFPGLRWFHPLA